MTAMAFLQPGPFEIIVVLFIVLLLFGAKKLPGLARSMGKSLQEFKRGKDEVMRELNDAQSDMTSGTSSEDEYDDEIDSEEEYAEDIEPEEEAEADSDEEEKSSAKTKKDKPQ